MNLIYLRLDGIDGEEPLDSKQKMILLHGYNHQLRVPIAPMRGSVGENVSLRRSYCTHDLFVVEKAFDKTSPKLFAACSAAVVFETAVVHVCQSERSGPLSDELYGIDPFLSITLEDAVIAEFNYGFVDGWQMEQLSFRYTSIGWKTAWVDPVSGEAAKLEPIGWNGEENKSTSIDLPSNAEWKNNAGLL